MRRKLVIASMKLETPHREIPALKKAPGQGQDMHIEVHALYRIQ